MLTQEEYDIIVQYLDRKPFSRKNLDKYLASLLEAKTLPITTTSKAQSRNLKGCINPARKEGSKGPSEFEKKNMVKIRTEGDSARGEGIR